MLLVGGMTKMPVIARTLRDRFGLARRLQDPHLAVAKGAAIFALVKRHRERGTWRRSYRVLSGSRSSIAPIPRSRSTRAVPARTFHTCLPQTRHCPPTQDR